MKTPLACHILGHAINHEASYYYGVEYCDRCEKQVPGNTGLKKALENLGWALWRIRDAMCDCALRVRQWLTCSDCGRHFGRHDDAFDHIPF